MPPLSTLLFVLTVAQLDQVNAELLPLHGCRLLRNDTGEDTALIHEPAGIGRSCIVLHRARTLDHVWDLARALSLATTAATPPALG